MVTIQLSIVVKLKPGFRVGNRTLFDGLIVNDTDAGSTTEGIVTNHLHTAWGEERKSVGIALGSTDTRLKEEVRLSVRVHHLLKVNVNRCAAMRFQRGHILLHEFTTEDDGAIPRLSELVLVNHIGQEVIQENARRGVFGLGGQQGASHVNGRTWVGSVQAIVGGNERNGLLVDVPLNGLHMHSQLPGDVGLVIFTTRGQIVQADRPPARSTGVWVNVVNP